MNFHSRSIDHACIDPCGKLVKISPYCLLWVELRPKVCDGFLACALGIVVLVTSRDGDDYLFGGPFVAEGDVVVQELAPRAENHCEVELVGGDDVAVEFGDRLAEEAGVGKVQEWLALTVLVAGWGSPEDVGVGFAPFCVFLVVCTAVNGSID